MRLPQIPYPAFRYLTLNPRGLAWPATRKIGHGCVKIIDGDSIECTVTASPEFSNRSAREFVEESDERAG